MNDPVVVERQLRFFFLEVLAEATDIYDKNQSISTMGLIYTLEQRLKRKWGPKL